MEFKEIQAITKNHNVELDKVIGNGDCFSIIITEISIPFDTIKAIVKDFEQKGFTWFNNRGEILNGKVMIHFKKME